MGSGAEKGDPQQQQQQFQEVQLHCAFRLKCLVDALQQTHKGTVI